MAGDFKVDGTPHRTIPEFSWATHIERLTCAEFKQRYRLDQDSFDKLLRILSPSLNMQNAKQAACIHIGYTTTGVGSK